MSPETTRMDPWLKKHLEAIGVIVDGATQRVRPHRCPLCGAWVLRGLTSPPLQELVVMDPYPLSNEGELMAILTGRSTYDLARRAGRLEVEPRDQFIISGSPADSPNEWRRYADVVAAHHCHADRLPGCRTRIRK